MKPRVRRRKLRNEATMLIAFAIAVVWVIPTEWIVSWAARSPRQIRRFADPDLPLWIAEAVTKAAARFDLTAPCLPVALTAQQMLRRRGVASTLHLGVRREESKLLAHAWIEVEGKIVVGQTEKTFASITSYGE